MHDCGNCPEHPAAECVYGVACGKVPQQPPRKACQQIAHPKIAAAYSKAPIDPDRENLHTDQDLTGQAHPAQERSAKIDARPQQRPQRGTQDETRPDPRQTAHFQSLRFSRGSSQEKPRMVP